MGRNMAPTQRGAPRRMATEDLCHFTCLAKQRKPRPMVHKSNALNLKPADARFQERMGQQLAMLHNLMDQHERDDTHHCVTRSRLRQLSQATSVPHGGSATSVSEQREAQQQRYQVKLRRHVALLEEALKWNAQRVHTSTGMV